MAFILFYKMNILYVIVSLPLSMQNLTCDDSASVGMC